MERDTGAGGGYDGGDDPLAGAPPHLSLPRILHCSAGLGPGSTWPLAPEAAAAWTSTDEQNTIQMIFIIIL